ncbi:MAG TPA: PQQ-dependent sugar dehydrogenase [Candidatus Limnocylindria bacterium]|nr:PQQ-dependent sugar dehydrogenase [Candidatus Limnocylindria bacterium]
MPGVALTLIVGLALLGAAGCSDGSEPPAALPTASVTDRTPPSPSGSPSSAASPDPGTQHQLSVGRDLVSGLAAPWGLAVLPDGDALVSERDSGRILRVSPGGAATVLGTVPDVQHGGEGGLLGLAVDPASPDRVYAYLTSTLGDNRIVSLTYGPTSLGQPKVIFTGIPSGTIHNGGRMVFGPDGNLWVGTGEAGLRDPAQNKDSLGGKILRISPAGRVPDGNPFPGSPVWSLGHRNVQGLAFDSTGQLWATEFGQNTWDELNEIQEGGNYGWPIVEGKTGGKAFVDPLVVWRPEEASPSGLAIVDDVAYVAALRGARLWQIPLVGDQRGAATDAFTNEFGRLRTVVATSEGDLWLTTSNTDGRGSPAPTDDRILRIALT